MTTPADLIEFAAILTGPWKPIETAPKDRTLWILSSTALRLDAVKLGYWKETKGMFYNRANQTALPLAKWWQTHRPGEEYSSILDPNAEDYLASQRKHP